MVQDCKAGHGLVGHRSCRLLPRRRRVVSKAGEQQAPVERGREDATRSDRRSDMTREGESRQVEDETGSGECDEGKVE